MHTATTEFYTYVHTLSLHVSLPICRADVRPFVPGVYRAPEAALALTNIVAVAAHRLKCPPRLVLDAGGDLEEGARAHATPPSNSACLSDAALPAAPGQAACP